jgi:hypothetical protein
MPALRTIVYSGTSPSSRRSYLPWNLCRLKVRAIVYPGTSASGRGPVYLGTLASCKRNCLYLGISISKKRTCLRWNLCQLYEQLSTLEPLPAAGGTGYPGTSARQQARGPAYPGTSVSCKINCLAWNLCQQKENLSTPEPLPG